MDLLQTLNLEDLPEQQTRMSNQLAESQPDFQLRLGFDACCSCGKPEPKLECEGCRRIKYCSDKCRKTDSLPPEDEEERALGHSSILCALLRTCTDDEQVVDGHGKAMQNGERAAAIDRVVSEYESYPATLSNVLLDGPCYQERLRQSTGDQIEIHIIGAATDSELWEGHPEKAQRKNIFACYAEALADLADKYKLKRIRLKFIGPDCPKEDVIKVIPIFSFGKTQSKCELQVMTKRKDYSKTLLEREGFDRPDFAIFFNPGFTCPDYSWDEALTAIRSETPYLVTTNTELEGIADVQYLLDHAFIRDIPAGLTRILETDTPADDTNENNNTFFSVNPFCGNRVRQSGTMANDLFVKSRWIFGGKFCRPSNKGSARPSKKRRIEGSGNSKKKNPALI
eukprot:scaffold26676_cov137-Cylindrotheca_fusiformis.AAC.7